MSASSAKIRKFPSGNLSPLNLKKTLDHSVSSAKRIGQTTFSLQKATFRWLKDRQQPVPQLVRETMEDLGATYIKLGQLIASSPSIFPHEYVEACQSCLDQTKPLPFKTIEKVIKQELGKDYRRLFRSIDPVPLASASIAQVHAAEWMNGDQVVIKVQKPGVEETLGTDFNFLTFSAKLLEKLNSKIPKSSITDMVEEIRNGMMEECDFMKEAQNIQAYRNFLRETDITDVVVPNVYLKGTAKRVLTMERFYGAPLSNLEKVKTYAEDPETVLIDALNTWVTSLTHCQIYHADLHAGNVMILEDGRIGFIDFGIVGKVSKPTWDALMNLTISIPQKDYMSIANSLVTIGATNEGVNAAALASDIERFIGALTEGEDDNFNNPDQFLQDITIRLSEIARKHGIRFPREFTLLIKQFLYFDRYIRLLAPELEIFSDERVLLGQD